MSSITSKSASTITTLAFWAMGVLNNIPYVVMLAGAKSISEGGTALVFLANIIPGFLLKLSSPYWFDKVSYRTRMRAGSVLMMLSFTLVASFSHLKEASKNDNDEGDDDGINFFVFMQLLGVALCSAQGSLGEATLLALSGKADSFIANEQKVQNTSRASTENEEEEVGGNCSYQIAGKESDFEETSDELQKEEASLCITAFASGTGLAGVLGIAFIVVLTDLFSFSLTGALYCALVFPVCYNVVFNKFLSKYATAALDLALDEQETMVMNTDSDGEQSGNVDVNNSDSVGSLKIDAEDDFADNPWLHAPELSNSVIEEENETQDNAIKHMSTVERLRLTMSLWPYMIPLFTVYAAEYALQSGIWTAIGFPVDDLAARNSFYIKSNWTYQIGVFISRSSGAFFTAPMWLLWVMPILQCINLVFFYFVATYHFWYDYSLLVPCFYVGLLGGGVYVHGYMRINKDLPMSQREFALSTSSVADTLGIMLADISGLFIQSCLYRNNGLNGSVVSCPL